MLWNTAKSSARVMEYYDLSSKTTNLCSINRILESKIHVDFIYYSATTNICIHIHMHHCAVPTSYRVKLVMLLLLLLLLFDARASLCMPFVTIGGPCMKTPGASAKLASVSNSFGVGLP